MEITTKSGIKFEIDTEDYEKVKAYFWYAQKLRNTFYISAMALSNGQRKRIWLHRLITNAPDGFDVDHADGNGLNNVRTNLRICSRAQNAANRRPNSRSSSKFKGVSWRERDKRWRASIRANGNRKWIGYFKTEKEAALAYNEQAKVLHGEFARLNVL